MFQSSNDNGMYKVSRAIKGTIHGSFIGDNYNGVSMACAILNDLGIQAYHLCYKKLGHHSYNTTLKMVKYTYVFISYLNKASFFYSYQMTKAYKFPFLVAYDRACTIYDLVYLNLETSLKLSRNIERYFMSIMNDFSRFIWFFPFGYQG